MYQVVTMFGDNEPWWFFENWEEDIEIEESFSSFEEAKRRYEEKWLSIRNHYTYINAKNNFLSAFWNDGDGRWCEECDDDLQQYKGLALLKNHQPITSESRKELYEITNSSGKTKHCDRLHQSSLC